VTEDDQYPIVYEDAPYFQLELTGIQRLAFCVADDPFFKSERSKYFPEVFLINKKSKIQAMVSPAGK
jgi:hypothetical protein